MLLARSLIVFNVSKPGIVLCLVMCIGLTLLWAQESLHAQSVQAPIQLAQSENQGFNPFRALGRIFRNDRESERERSRSNAPRQNRQPAVPQAPVLVEEPKDPDAGVILVVGDRMARGVADGLRHALAKQPMARVEEITRDDMGLAGDTAPDWPQLVLSKVRGANVEAVVVMLGRHDLSKTFPAEPPTEFMTDAWQRTYRDKVDALVRAVRRERLPIVWVGLPPTNTQLMNADFTTLNGIFKDANIERRARFIDIWDIFLSDAGEYTSFGPDVDGTNRRLRTSDRIGFTWAGHQKIAFFVERELIRLLGGFGGLVFEGVDDDPNFMVLTGRTTSPEAELLGGDARMPEPDTNSQTYRFLVLGEPIAAVPGRVDSPLLAVRPGSSQTAGAPSGS